MSILQRAIETLSGAEVALKRLIGEAAEQGEYSSVETLVRWASSLGAMCSEKESPKPSRTDVNGEARNQSPAPKTRPQGKNRPRATKHGKRRAYPLFAKSGDSLVKIGWSKSSKSEYQHKAPRIVVTKLVEALARHSSDDSIISMDNILPIKVDDESAIPDYQVYVSLAWLRQIGAVKQNGRQGYTVKKANDLLQQVEAAWSSLPKPKSI